MIQSSSSRVQRAAALGLLVSLIVMFAFVAIAPLVRVIRSEFEQRKLCLKEIAKFQGLVNAEPELRGVLARIDAHPVWQRLYREQSDDAAGAELQKDFRALAEAQGIAVDTLQPLDAADDRDFRRISLRVGFVTSIDHLSQLLVAMRAAPRFMKFENLYITSPMSQNGGGNAPLVVRGDVLAFRLPEPAS